MSELSVIVTRIRHPPATDTEATWFVLETSAGPCAGKMSWRPRDNESLILEGEPSVYRGSKQFSFSSARLNIPTDPRHLLNYVCERTSGMGTHLANQIWEKYGADWQNAQPGSIPRFGGAVYERWRLSLESLKQNAEQAAIVSTLVGKGCTDLTANKAYSQWRSETLGVVQSDPFQLAELERVTFATVDKGIRQAYGITDTDPRRIKAAVVHTLRNLTSNGSTVVSWEDLFSNACAALGGYDDLVHAATTELLKCGTLKGFPDAGMICLASDYRAENDIWEYVTRAT